MSTIKTLMARADKARRDAEAVDAQLGEAYRQAEQQRAAAIRQAWQNIADAYDPDADRRAVVDTGAALRTAVTEGDALGPAIRDHAAAIMREREHAQLALSAAHGGAQLAAQLGPIEYRDPAGARIPSGMTRGGAVEGGLAGYFGPGLVVTMAVEAAQATVAAEVAAIRATITEARESVEVAQPPYFKMVAKRFTDDHEIRVGGETINFLADPAGSVAYVPAGHPAIHYYRNFSGDRDAFEFHGVFAVPDSHLPMIERVATGFRR